jgi:hypothetical protein
VSPTDDGFAFLLSLLWPIQRIGDAHWATSHTLPAEFGKRCRKMLVASGRCRDSQYCTVCSCRLRKMRDDEYDIGKDDEIRMKFTRRMSVKSVQVRSVQGKGVGCFS